MQSKLVRGTVVAAMITLAGCGGGSNDTSTAANNTVLLSSISTASGENNGTTALVRQGAAASTAGSTTASSTASTAVTPAAAAHFLSQASFGPIDSSINFVATNGPAAWLDVQLWTAQTSFTTYMTQLQASLPSGSKVTAEDMQSAFWWQAITGFDQLRGRVAYALSQIFVVSAVNGELYQRPYGMSSYYDVLGKNALGNFRDLLTDVALHPTMGIYLNHLRNQKETDTRMPDENFARELMQLMTIGLYQLNQDGTLKLQDGKPVETYTHDDVMGLAKVFTGWSWGGPDQSDERFWGTVWDPNRDTLPMQNYPKFHSTASKSFLGVTVSGGGTAASEVKTALDTLFNHPNVGPFISRQLIQRLVTSNPSPAYVSRVAAKFNNNGSGVRGDMKAVVKAILLDSEAMDTTTTKKLREPVLRQANWLRAFKATSVSGKYLFWAADSAVSGLGQSPLRAPSVFNFYRPGYVPPNTALASAGMVAPEMQITGEPSVIGYLNYMQNALLYGVGKNSEVKGDYSTELAMVDAPDKLVDRINLLLMSGTMSSSLRSQLIAAVTSVVQPKVETWNGYDVANAKRNRVYLAIYLTMASPEYLAQK
ncbi:DUF1800 family protein [Oxalobacteraceae bacterium A2-2]